MEHRATGRVPRKNRFMENWELAGLQLKRLQRKKGKANGLLSISASEFTSVYQERELLITELITNIV